MAKHNPTKLKVYFFWLIILINLSTQAQTVDQNAKFRRVLNLIENNYTDTVNSSKLVESAIIALLENLDPHSIYIPKEEIDEMNDPLEGNFDGIGIQFNLLKDTILVVATIPGGPSEKVGIQAGDRIISVNGNPIGKNFSNQDVRKNLMGPRGTTVNVGIKRKGVRDRLEFTITRDKIPIYSLDASYMIDKKIGYIKLNRFSATTMDEYQKAFKDLKSQGCVDLILDLQDNGGGFLNVAFELADEFLDKNKLIVYTEGRANPRTDYLSGDKGDFEKGKLVILVNEGSASASEILAGAIQDWDRGVILGRRTFGKGLVQREFNLTEGSAIRLTIARYFTPTGRCIQKPFEKGSKDYENDLDERYKNGEMTNPDSIHPDEKLMVKTLRKSRTVYGGGGIMPDVFIPLDTTYYTDYYRDIIRTGFLNSFIVNYVDRNRTNFKFEYPAFETFNNSFIVDSIFFAQLIIEAKQQGIAERPDQIKQCSANLRIFIKALIARDLFGDSYYYQIINQTDNALLTATKLLLSNSDYDKILD